MRTVSLEAYRRLTLLSTVGAALLFGGGLVTLVQTQDAALALALMLAGTAAALATALVQIEGAPPTVPPSLLLYTRADCALCDEARALLDALRREVAFDVWEVDVDVDADPQARATFGDSVPVALRGDEVLFRGNYDEARVRAALGI